MFGWTLIPHIHQTATRSGGWGWLVQVFYFTIHTEHNRRIHKPLETMQEIVRLASQRVSWKKTIVTDQMN